MWLPFALFVIIFEVTVGFVEDSEWIGKMFPDPRTIQEGQKQDQNQDLSSGKSVDRDRHGRVSMGVKNKFCDWGEDILGLDGDLGPKSYTCFSDKKLYLPNPRIYPISRRYHIPTDYMAWHHCMNESIVYENVIPTYGHHRPLWPRYGEYSFLPKQRWLHSLEHGSVVMLYHPCADPNEIHLLRKILKGCLYQYVITALNELSAKRPLALVAWGVSLEMSKVDSNIVIDFIRKTAYKAPEDKSDDGQYDKNLIVPAPLKLKGQDKKLCPNN